MAIAADHQSDTVRRWFEAGIDEMLTGLFTPEEIRVLLDEVPALSAQHRPENVREKDSDAVRTNFAAHLYSAPFARLPSRR